MVYKDKLRKTGMNLEVERLVKDFGIAVDGAKDVVRTEKLNKRDFTLRAKDIGREGIYR